MSKMQKLLRRKNSIILFSVLALAASCKKPVQKSDMTGWNYNDKNMGGYNVAQSKNVKTGPGLVFVQGGSFTMGATTEDVMGDWNNIPRRVTVNSFFIDKTEVANVHYREYIHWIENVFNDPQFDAVVQGSKPDTLVWRSELAYNEPYVEYYFRHPSYNFYPVVGVSWKQAHDFSIWRTDRVNENELLQKGYQNKNVLKTELAGGGQENFNTKAYLMGEYQGVPGKPKSSKNQLKDSQGRPRNYVKFDDGILLPGYRLPTEAEWEYAALGYINQNPDPRKSEKKRGEENFTNRQIYSWQNDGFDNMRSTRHGTWQGQFLANFKRQSGDNMGIAGGLNDRSAIPSEITSFFPNGFGIYNMSGNVSEWVSDVYRPMTNLDADDFNPYRGNRFQKVDMAKGQGNLRDSIGRIKMIDEADSSLRLRRNYQRSYAVNYMDGDSITNTFYGYGVTTLISDESRVVKGGSWNDRPYWLSPGTRRFLEQDQSSSTIGFRCAMIAPGSPEGPNRKTGNFFPKRRQKK